MRIITLTDKDTAQVEAVLVANDDEEDTIVNALANKNRGCGNEFKIHSTTPDVLENVLVFIEHGDG